MKKIIKFIKFLIAKFRFKKRIKLNQIKTIYILYTRKNFQMFLEIIKIIFYIFLSLILIEIVIHFFDKLKNFFIYNLKKEKISLVQVITNI